MARWIGIALTIFAGAATARADMLTGDPVADGWSRVANSLDNGFYIRGAGNYSFDTYRRDFTVAAGNPLTTMVGAWSVGDRVLALGGMFTPTTPVAAGWPNFSGPSVNSLINGSVRIVGKFGTSPSAFGPSTVAPGAGNGAGPMKQVTAGWVRWYSARRASELSPRPMASCKPRRSPSSGTAWSAPPARLLMRTP